MRRATRKGRWPSRLVGAGAVERSRTRARSIGSRWRALGRRGGIVRATARGGVFDLKKLEDFSGNYVAGGAGVTVGVVPARRS